MKPSRFNDNYDHFVLLWVVTANVGPLFFFLLFTSFTWILHCNFHISFDVCFNFSVDEYNSFVIWRLHVGRSGRQWKIYRHPVFVSFLFPSRSVDICIVFILSVYRMTKRAILWFIRWKNNVFFLSLYIIDIFTYYIFAYLLNNNFFQSPVRLPSNRPYLFTFAGDVS